MSDKILKQLEEMEKIIDDMSPEELRELYEESLKDKQTNPEQYALIERQLLSKNKSFAKCEACGKLKPSDEVYTLSGMDYEMYAVSTICKDCL